LQSGESLLSSINEYKKRDTPNEKYKKGKLIYAVIKTLINTKAELSAKELAEMLGTSTACARKSLNVLIETRDVERKRYGKLYKYRLAEWVSVEYSYINLDMKHRCCILYLELLIVSLHNYDTSFNYDYPRPTAQVAGLFLLTVF